MVWDQVVSTVSPQPSRSPFFLATDSFGTALQATPGFPAPDSALGAGDRPDSH